MTTFAKCLVIFAVGASFAFLGATWVSLKGGLNWDAEAAALPAYTIAKGEGPTAKWSVTDRETEKAVNVAAPGTQAAAIVAARNHLQEKQQKEIGSLREEAERDKKKLDEVRKFNAADTKALNARVEELNSQLKKLNDDIVKMSNEVVKRSQEAQVIRLEAAKRREDVYRLKRELEEIHADKYRADELQTKLRDQLVRLTGIEMALESRNKQLHGE